MKNCHACGAEVVLTGRVGRRDVCDVCSADLHCCLNCRHHNPFAQNECNEPQSEPVRDRHAGNLCEFFDYGDGKKDSSDPAAEARARLDALFRKS